MHHPLPSIVDTELVTVCGGGTSTASTALSIRANPPDGKPVDVNTSTRFQRSDLDTCIRSVKQLGGTPAEVAAACGIPPRS
jgi:hypothetical protein